MHERNAIYNYEDTPVKLLELLCILHMQSLKIHDEAGQKPALHKRKGKLADRKQTAYHCGIRFRSLLRYCMELRGSCGLCLVCTKRMAFLLPETE